MSGAKFIDRVHINGSSPIVSGRGAHVCGACQAMEGLSHSTSDLQHDNPCETDIARNRCISAGHRHQSLPWRHQSRAGHAAHKKWLETCPRPSFCITLHASPPDEGPTRFAARFEGLLQLSRNVSQKRKSFEAMPRSSFSGESGIRKSEGKLQVDLHLTCTLC
jgi:hypothetical protein